MYYYRDALSALSQAIHLPRSVVDPKEAGKAGMRKEKKKKKRKEKFTFAFSSNSSRDTEHADKERQRLSSNENPISSNNMVLSVWLFHPRNVTYGTVYVRSSLRFGLRFTSVKTISSRASNRRLVLHFIRHDKPGAHESIDTAERDHPQLA